MEWMQRMKRPKATWLPALAAGWVGSSLILSLILSLSQAGPAQAQGAEALVMVVNKANGSAAGMNLGEARKLLLGETGAWHNGAKVVVVLEPAGSADRTTVLKKVCGMSEAAYTRFAMQAAFTGATAATVKEAPSDAAVKSAVRANPGAVGFIHKAAADDTVTVVLALE